MDRADTQAHGKKWKAASPERRSLAAKMTEANKDRSKDGREETHQERDGNTAKRRERHGRMSEAVTYS